MTMENSEKVLEIIAEQAGVHFNEIDPQTSLQGDVLDFDELDINELAMTIEAEFGIVIADEDFEDWRTVQHIINYVEIYE